MPSVATTAPCDDGSSAPPAGPVADVDGFAKNAIPTSARNAITIHADITHRKILSARSPPDVSLFAAMIGTGWIGAGVATTGEGVAVVAAVVESA